MHSDHIFSKLFHLLSKINLPQANNCPFITLRPNPHLGTLMLASGVSDTALSKVTVEDVGESGASEPLSAGLWVFARQCIDNTARSLFIMQTDKNVLSFVWQSAITDHSIGDTGFSGLMLNLRTFPFKCPLDTKSFWCGIYKTYRKTSL